MHARPIGRALGLPLIAAASWPAPFCGTARAASVTTEAMLQAEEGLSVRAEAALDRLLVTASMSSTAPAAGGISPF